MTPPGPRGGGCPPPAALLRLGADSREADAFDAMESHVAACPSCRDRLELLARLDSASTGAGRPGLATPPEIPGCVLGSELGRGGSGVVYEAFQPRLDRRVAVKVLSGGPGLDARARARWLREARAVARVRHPNIVQLHEAGEHDGRLYLILDLIPGGSLRRRPGAGRIPPREAARMIEAVARAVEAIHRAGLLHLDVKPSNILLDGPPGAGWPGLTPLLSDFGVALDEADDASVWEMRGARGTPAFMAPEQAACLPGSLGPAADVFALGSTLYALLTDRPPYPGGSSVEALARPGSAGPPPPRALAPGLSRDLETIVLTCLAMDPARRYGSAADLADDLRRWMDGFPIRARRASAAGRLARWCRRRPALAGLAFTLAATVLVALVGLTALWRRSESQRGRAEAALARALEGEATADAAVADLSALLRDVVEAPERSSSERSVDATSAVLALAAKLRRTPEIAARHAVAVAGLERRLAAVRLRDGSFDDVGRLLDDALALLDAGRGGPSPGPVEVDTARAEVLAQRGGLRQTLDRRAEAAEDFRRAALALEPHADDPRALEALTAVHTGRRSLAEALAQLGDPEAGRREALADAEWFEGLARRTGDPSLALIVALARRGAGPVRPAEGSVLRELERLPDGATLPPRLGVLVADLAARELCDEVASVGDPEEAGRRLFAEMDARLARRRLPPGFRDEVVERISQDGCRLAYDARHAGQVDESRRVAGWMIAMAHALAAREPKSVGARLMLSRALEQQAKDGWAAGDPQAVERSLRAALAEAAAAFELAPDDEICRRHLAGLREKYVRLAAAEPDRQPAADRIAERHADGR